MEKARLISQGECETHIHKQPREGTPDRIIRGFRLSGVAWHSFFTTPPVEMDIALRDAVA